MAKIDLSELLYNNFGYRTFRELQKKPILSILNGNDTLTVIPTGEGKSIIFQIPGLYFNGLTIVISPLISLMKDQVESLKKKNIKAEYYNSTLTSNEKREIWDKIYDGNIKFLYIAPERIFMDDFIDKIKENIKISLIAIDEIHCITWGSFRPEYLQLKEIKSIFKNVPLIGLTATAEPLILKELKDSFGFKDENIFINSPIRENLNYNVEKKVANGYDQIYKIIKNHNNDSGIIYCYSKKEVDSLTTWLKKNNIKTAKYHADLTQTVKDKAYEDFINNKVQIVVATIAFGMGIDKSNIRFVIHKEPSYTLENYVQETGRAGRDQKDSKIYLLYSKKDLITFSWILNSGNALEKNKFYHMKMYMESNYCYNQIIEKYFINDIKIKECGKCNNCLNKKNFEYFINKEFSNEIYKILLENDRNYTPKMLSNKILLNENITINEYVIENYLYQLHISGFLNYDVSRFNYCSLSDFENDFSDFKYIKPVEPFTNFKLSENRVFNTISTVKKKVVKTVKSKPTTKSTSSVKSKSPTKSTSSIKSKSPTKSTSSVKSKSPTKSTSSIKSKSPTKSTSSVKSKSPTKSTSSIKSKSPTKSTSSIKSKSPPKSK
jgi:RecQ family ATP-dependent DNA helicase